jgi:hypothetical protein
MITRRRFLSQTALATGALTFPNLLLAQGSPAEKINVACIGVGGMNGGR